MKIDHVECQVACDGEVLTEYEEKEDGQKARSCHIISEAGKVVLLHIRLSYVIVQLSLQSAF